jgi:biotin synthase
LTAAVIICRISAYFAAQGIIMTQIQSNRQWTLDEAKALYQGPLLDLVFEAQQVHRQHFAPNQVQLSSLLSVKTGACPEDCKYCSQSGHNKTDLQKEKLLPLDQVVEIAKQAKARGSTRFCMGAAWRSPPQKEMPKVVEMVKAVKALGMETCFTAGMLDAEQASELKEAGLDYYNHNLDTSRDYYPEITTTRTYDDRLDTLKNVREAGINVCCGGILNLGESLDDRLKLLLELANMQPSYPESVPINKLVPIPGTPLAKQQDLDSMDFVRIIAMARIMMPKTFVRLSAGRNSMSEELHALCFMAGANSIHYGEKLLTTELPGAKKDKAMLEKLGIQTIELENSEQTQAQCA